MASRKKTGRYVVLRDFGDMKAGDGVDLSDEDAALLVRDGMVSDQNPPAEEGEE